MAQFGQHGLASLLATLAHPPSVEALRDVRNAARRLARGALAAGTDVVEASRLLTAVSDRTVRVLLVIAHRELGPAPSDYAWLALGSHARREQLPSSDQDTGLVYAAGLDRDGHDWFVTLGEWMTDALEACGYRRCPGGVMASRPDWRHDLAGWADMVRQWTDPSDSSRLVGADIGFDVHAVAGAGTLDPDGVDRRLARMIIDTTGNALTAARLARGAVARRPPSALWGRVGRNPLGPSLGERGRRIDLKRDAVQPIVDIARMHTLARGATEVPTGDRLAAAAVDGVLSADLAATLIEGHRLLTWTRLAAQLSDTPDADDRVGWAELPRPLRAQFSDTFGAIRAAQDALRTSHHLVAGS